MRDLATHFETPRGVVRAVDGVSFTLDRGAALGIVGESGSGKTILSRSIMGLLPQRGTMRSGQVLFEGTDILPARRSRQMRRFWGKEMAMIFQDPMTSLNPLMKIGKQIAEPLRIHLGMSTQRRSRRRPSGCSTTFASPRPAGASTSTPTSCRAACASG